ncbi:cytokine receptor common subunit beta [Protobothrops mucrosquamatus]|uniref:cytokine receptor common subunit beta n=1 Tax=Protobothrops mucrosquamatus TaxID=103944 RepID=UPI0010FB3D0C|nr:cytokine receptor common subunit beta [Protobothrops mucrosquamatus]
MKPYSIALTLSLIVVIIEARESRLHETLCCSNDYTSHISCTWSEPREGNAFVKMHLFEKHNDLNLTKMICNSKKLDSEIHWHCRRNETRFNSLLINSFIFKPDRKLEIQLNVDLFKNIQLLPPEKLNVTATEECNFLLEWKAGGGTNRNQLLEGVPLDFEISYKRTWELWEESSSVLVSNKSHYCLRHSNVVPGSRYVARVRNKPSPGSGFAGRYSDWSPVVTWQTPESTDDAVPKNLQCYFNGIDRLKCSWEVRQEISNSVLFTLFYKDKPGSKEMECSEVYQEALISNNATYHVLQSCEINVTNSSKQSQYLVRVIPKEEVKEIKMYLNIKPDPPYNLSMSVIDGPQYILHWDSKIIHTVFDLQKTYQISYWETGKPSEVRYVDNTTNQKFTFTSHFLELGKNYIAKVRTIVSDPDYQGYWSEWSEDFGWQTTSGFPLWGILLITVVCIILMMGGICFCQKYLLSKKKKWEANIPSPPKTFLLPSFFPVRKIFLKQKVQLANHSEDSSALAKEEINYSSKLERELLIGSPAAIEDEFKKTPQLLWSQNMKKIDLLNKANAVQTCTNPNTQTFDFNGPYMYSSAESFAHTVQQDLKVTPSEVKETPVSLRCIGLQTSLSLQQQPGGEKENTLSDSDVHQQVEEKLLFPTGQEASQIQETGGQLKKEKTTGCLSSSNSHCQNLPLDYIATVDLSISKEKGCLLPLPVLVSEERMLPCANTATVAAHMPKTKENLSNSELCQKTLKPTPPVMDQSISDLSAISQEESSDYLMSFSAASGAVPKDGLAFAMEESKQDILIFNVGGRSPLFLYQEGEYCFFPGSKTKEDSKGQEAPVGHQPPESFPKVTKYPLETKFADSKLQVISQVCQDV